MAYSSLAHVGLIAAGCYTLTLDGLSGAVSQMIAHGFVIVDYSSLQKSSTEDTKQEKLQTWEESEHKHQSLLPYL